MREARSSPVFRGEAANQPPADIFSAMGKASPLVTHTLPWSTMAFSSGLSAVLFFAALQIAQAREY